MAVHWKLTAAAAGLTFAALYLVFCGRVYTAQASAASADVNRLRKAALTRPTDADVHYALGRQLWLQQHDVDAAIREYSEATRINPYNANYWIELAATYNVAGRDVLRDRAIERAYRAAPRDLEVLWDVANLNLMRGDTLDALHELRTVMEYEDEGWDEDILFCWRITQDVDLLLREAIPAKSGGYSSLLRLMMRHDDAAAAVKVWNAAAALHVPIAVPAATDYISYLLAKGLGDEAEAGWRQITSSHAALSGYAANDHDLVVNGGFELPILNTGLDWQYGGNADASVAIDQTRSHTGHASLSIAFERNPRDAGIFQRVPVKPGAAYHISAFARSELEGVSLPRLAVFDGAGETPVFVSDAVSGAADWRELGGDFRAPAGSHFVTIRIVRSPWQTQIRGRLWLDDVAMRPQ